MGRIISTVAVSSPSPSPIASLNRFGTGQVMLFTNSGTFVVPDGVTSVRARVFGGGGAGRTSNGNGSAGGTSSFGAHVSATGGGGFSSSAPSGGTGSNGDINRTGGSGAGNGNAGVVAGGGGVAGIFSNGGNATTSAGESGNAGAGSASSNQGGSGFLGEGTKLSSTNDPSRPAQGAWQNLSIDFLGCGGGGTTGKAGINGGGGGTVAPGSWPGGGGGGNSFGSGAGGGFAIKTITNLTPGSSITVTVGAGGTADPTTSNGAPGVVVVEW